jgi:E3 SUMO-protein ligase RanBP2
MSKVFGHENVLERLLILPHRYDKDSKQWKERGIGDIKILKNAAKNTFRVLLRRDQIHKIACNHLILKDMKLMPMAGSETAVCYYAQDFTDGEYKTENLAVKFKLAGQR